MPEVRLVTRTGVGNINGGLGTVLPPAAGGSLTLASHPNPFNPQTTIRFHLPATGPARSGRTGAAQTKLVLMKQGAAAVRAAPKVLVPVRVLP